MFRVETAQATKSLTTRSRRNRSLMPQAVANLRQVTLHSVDPGAPAYGRLNVIVSAVESLPQPATPLRFPECALRPGDRLQSLEHPRLESGVCFQRAGVRAGRTIDRRLKTED